MTILTVSGIRFTEPTLGRIVFVQGGQWHGWVIYEVDDGLYRPYRRATEQDQAKFVRAMEEGTR